MPVNVFGASIEPLLRSTIGSFFTQNWSLFAPNPVTSTREVLVKCMQDDSELTNGEWHNISRGFIEGSQAFRLSAYSRAARPSSNFADAYINGPTALQPFASACTRGDQESCITYNEGKAAARKSAGQRLAKVATLYCKDAYDGPFERVAVRLRERPQVRWKDRHHGKASHRDFDLGVYPASDKAAQMRIFTEPRQ